MSVTNGINYLGRLTDRSGSPLTGTYTMTFGLYETATGGTALPPGLQDTRVYRIVVKEEFGSAIIVRCTEICFASADIITICQTHISNPTDPVGSQGPLFVPAFEIPVPDAAGSG